jgi:hypothetical protein
MPCSRLTHPDYAKLTCASACFTTYVDDIMSRINQAREEKRAKYAQRGEDAVSSDAAAEDADVPDLPELEDDEDDQSEA